jgi:hypothetical protein
LFHLFESRRLGLAALLIAAGGPALAQGAGSAPSVPDTAAPASAATPADGVIPALTPIVVEILADEGSGTSKPGDTFPLRLAEPIKVDDAELVPAGAVGVGEVIHAKKSGGSGSGGELILAADYLEVDGRHLPLRSLNLSGVGRDRYGTVNSIGIAGAATVPGVALIGMFIKGKQVVIPKGTVAAAKTAVAFTVSAPAPATTAAAPAAEAPAATTSTGG